MNRLSFSIAGISFGLETPLPLTVTKAFLPFQTEMAPDCLASFVPVEALAAPAGLPVYQGDCFRVYDDPCQSRLFYPGLTGEEAPYALAQRLPGCRDVRIEYLPEALPHINESANCFFHIGWESTLLSYGRLILHACAVDTPYGAILFSGVSGVGKSTQGNLWIEQMGASPINGDRPILRKDRQGGWLACGSPYAGSSRWYEAVEKPIRAIVMLQQAKENRIRPLSPALAFRRLYAQLVVCDWDKAYTLQLCDLTEDLAQALPVYELACTPDHRAVDLLKETLEGG